MSQTWDSGDVPVFYSPADEEFKVWVAGLHAGLTAGERPGTPRERARAHFLVLGELEPIIERMRAELDEHHEVSVFFDGQPGQSKLLVVFPETVWVA